MHGATRSASAAPAPGSIAMLTTRGRGCCNGASCRCRPDPTNCDASREMAQRVPRARQPDDATPRRCAAPACGTGPCDTGYPPLGSDVRSIRSPRMKIRLLCIALVLALPPASIAGTKAKETAHPTPADAHAFVERMNTEYKAQYLT